MIEVEQIERRFGEFVLGPVSLRVGPGEYRVLLGPSGAGKSMLLHTLVGGFEPEDGRISIGDVDVTRAPPEKRNIGMVFQHSALFPHLSVYENLAYGLRARGLAAGERRRRIDEVVATVRIESLLGRPTATLSGGESQKVAIARALAIRPRVLLLDEPLGPIDHDARRDLTAVLERLHRDLGLTTVHVTHSREEARALADHCTVMVGGRLVQSGTTEELFSRPRCTFVARFLGVEPSRVAAAPECGDGCVHQPGHCTAPV